MPAPLSLSAPYDSGPITFYDPSSRSMVAQFLGISDRELSEITIIGASVAAVAILAVIAFRVLRRWKIDPWRAFMIVALHAIPVVMVVKNVSTATHYIDPTTRVVVFSATALITAIWWRARNGGWNIAFIAMLTTFNPLVEAMLPGILMPIIAIAATSVVAAHLAVVVAPRLPSAAGAARSRP